MADAAGLLPGLPDEIAVWEILVRLPPKPLLRCRATSTRDFLLSHHARQPDLLLLCSYSDDDDGPVSLDIGHFDHRAADWFRPVAQLQAAPYERHPSANPELELAASRDGLLLLTIDLNELCICNPATRQYAPLPQLKGFAAVEIYPHPPTDEYRVLLHRQGAVYVFTIGSGQQPRQIGHHDLNGVDDYPGLLFQGSIYWHADSEIKVFDTTDESFRHIRAPVDHGYGRVFEMGGMLGIFSHNDQDTAIDIWVMRQNHQGEVWDFNCRVELPLAETRQQCQCYYHLHFVMVVPGEDGGLLILIRCKDWLFHVDIDGKLIASFHLKGIRYTHYVLKQTLVQHTFFPTLDGYVVDAPPFF